MSTELEPVETEEWNDAKFSHAYEGKFNDNNELVWNGGPALCGYNGCPKKPLSLTPKPNCCPICLVLFQERNKK